MKFNISLFFLSLFLLVFFLVGFVSAANWYVDRDAPVGGNGQSWGTAWNNFSVINWSRVQPGDTIYISGGVTEKVYNEGMTIGKSGTVNNPIIITRGKDPGHNGRVILRSPVQSSGFGVYIYEKSNIIIEDLDLELWATSVYIKSRTSPPFDNNPNAVKNIVIRNNRAILAGNFVETNNFHSPTNEEYIERIKNIWVINNSWITVNWSSVQTDFFSFGQTKNVFVIGNRGVNYNNNPDTHDDFCQGGDGTNIYFINNFFRHDNSVTKMGNANGLSGISNYGGDGFFINNILVEPPTSIGYPIMLFYRPIERPDLYYRNWVKVKILGNTLVAAHVSGIRYGYDPYGEIKNNIFYSSNEWSGSGSGRLFFISIHECGSPNPDNLTIRNNNFYNNYDTSKSFEYLNCNPPPMHSSNIMINGGSPNFVNWNSATINPLDFRISQNSNARNRGGALNILEMENSILSEPDMNGFSVGNYLGSGENLATYYAKRDFNGNLRGVDGSWDIGAFEYVSGVQCAPVDNDCNGCVSLSEISSFVARWLNGEISLSDVSGAVSLWLNGGC